jgi:CBS domain-containing membrane protein
MLHRLKVADIMSRELVTLAEDDTLAEARLCMERGRLRHLPVLRDGRLVGLVTHRDLLAASFSLFAEGSASEEHVLFSRILVRDLMHDVIAVSPSMSVSEAARILLEQKFGCLPVIEGDGKLVGIVTEADFLRLTVQMLDAIQA